MSQNKVTCDRWSAHIETVDPSEWEVYVWWTQVMRGPAVDRHPLDQTRKWSQKAAEISATDKPAESHKNHKDSDHSQAAAAALSLRTLRPLSRGLWKKNSDPPPWSMFWGNPDLPVCQSVFWSPEMLTVVPSPPSHHCLCVLTIFAWVFMCKSHTIKCEFAAGN